MKILRQGCCGILMILWVLSLVMPGVGVQARARSTVTISGIIADGGGHGYPLYARVSLEDGEAAYIAYTDPFSGAYSLDVPGDITYQMRIEAIIPGYLAEEIEITPAGNETVNAALEVDAFRCTAPGYQRVIYGGGTFENFDGVPAPPMIPGEWGQVDTLGTDGSWATATTTQQPAGFPPYSSPNLAYFNSYTAPDIRSRLYTLAGTDASASDGVMVEIQVFHNTGLPNNDDRVQMQYSLDGTNWVNVGEPIHRYDGSSGWKQHMVTLPAGAAVYLGIEGISEWGYDIHIDSIDWNPYTCEPEDHGGIVAGYVTDSTTGEPLAGRVIGNEISNTLFIDEDLEHAGLYWLFETIDHKDPAVITASAYPWYLPETANVDVIENGLVRVDFALDLAPLQTIGGVVTDGSGHAYPLYTQIHVTGNLDGLPGNGFEFDQWVYTDPFTGEYQIAVPDQQTYGLETETFFDGYDAVLVQATVSGSPLTQDFPLQASAGCDAPGYTTPKGAQPNLSMLACIPEPGGLVGGYISDGNTGLPVIGAAVSSDGLPGFTVPSVLWGTDSAHAGVYLAFQHNPPEVVTVTAAKARYTPAQATVTILSNSITRQDLTLTAGQLVVDSSQISSVQVPVFGELNAPLMLTNTGDAPLNYNIYELPVYPSGTTAQGSQLNAGHTIFGVDASAFPGQLISFVEENPSAVTTIATLPGLEPAGADFLLGDFTQLYTLDGLNNRLVAINALNGNMTPIGMAQPLPGHHWTGLTAGDDGLLYAASTNGAVSMLYTINPLTAAVEPVWPVVAASQLADIAINAQGEIFGVDVVTDMLIQLDLATGASAPIGPTGVNGTEVQGLDFDEATGILYWSASITPAESKLYTISPITGTATLVGQIGGSRLVGCLAVASFNPPSVSWLSLGQTTGTLAAGESISIPVNFAPDVLLPGIYEAGLLLVDNTPYMPIISGNFIQGRGRIPITMTVEPPLFEKSASPETTHGSQLTYTLNFDPLAATGTIAQIVDELPAGVTYVDGSLTVSSGYASYNPGTHTIVWASAPPKSAKDQGATVETLVTITFDVMVTALRGETISNQADLSYGSYLANRTVNTEVINAPPSAEDQAFSTDEDADYSGTAAGSDADGDALTYGIITEPEHGEIFLNAETGAFTYSPDDNYNGGDGFTFSVADGYGGTDTGAISITITPVNDAPIPPVIADVAWLMNAMHTYIAPPFEDPDGDALTYTASLSGGGNLPEWLSFDGQTRTFSGTPGEADLGDYPIEITAADPNAAAGTTTFTLKVVAELTENIYLPAILR